MKKTFLSLLVITALSSSLSAMVVNDPAAVGQRGMIDTAEKTREGLRIMDEKLNFRIEQMSAAIDATLQFNTLKENIENNIYKAIGGEKNAPRFRKVVKACLGNFDIPSFGLNKFFSLSDFFCPDLRKELMKAVLGDAYKNYSFSMLSFAKDGFPIEKTMASISTIKEKSNESLAKILNIENGISKTAATQTPKVKSVANSKTTNDIQNGYDKTRTALDNASSATLASAKRQDANTPKVDKYMQKANAIAQDLEDKNLSEKEIVNKNKDLTKVIVECTQETGASCASVFEKYRSSQLAKDGDKNSINANNSDVPRILPANDGGGKSNLVPFSGNIVNTPAATEKLLEAIDGSIKTIKAISDTMKRAESQSGVPMQNLGSAGIGAKANANMNKEAEESLKKIKEYINNYGPTDEIVALVHYYSSRINITKATMAGLEKAVEDGSLKPSGNKEEENNPQIELDNNQMLNAQNAQTMATLEQLVLLNRNIANLNQSIREVVAINSKAERDILLNVLDAVQKLHISMEYLRENQQITNQALGIIAGNKK